MSHHDRRFDPQKRHGLHSAEREAKWHPRSLLRSLGIQPGQTALDLGCGTGFWTLPLAELAGPAGLVWALDVSQEMLNARADIQPPPTGRLLHSELPHIDLPDGSVDWIWGAFVVHEVEPLAGLMEQKVEEAGKELQCIKTTLLASMQGYAPQVAIEFGRKVLYSTDRPSFTELEVHVKGKR
jgi:SAM-dependent methyltransferase